MREIGGYLQLDNFDGEHYHSGALRLNLARNALIYLIETKQIAKLYIPYLLCDSVKNAINKTRCEIEYYNIKPDFTPDIRFELQLNEYILIVNYYGQINKALIYNYKNLYKRIIIDNTQAFFDFPIDDVDTFNSCRKFVGVPDGSYLYTKNPKYKELEVDKSSRRFDHLLGRYENNASQFYNAFCEIDESFAKLELKEMSKLTANILNVIDYKKIIEKREYNYQALKRLLKNYNILKIKTPNGPFAYPFYVADGLSVKKQLASKKIYIPTLWPNVLQDCKKDTVEYDYAANILPLPCDQRYGVSEMEYLASILLEMII